MELIENKLSTQKNHSTQIQHRVQNKCINLLTKNGKKTKAYSLLNAALTLVIKRTRHLAKTSYNFPAGIPEAKLQTSSSGMAAKTNQANRKEDRRTEEEDLAQALDHGFEAKLQEHQDMKAHSIFLQSIENVKPIFEVRKVRIAGNTLLVPALIPFQRQENKALRWIIEGAKERKRKNSKSVFEDCLATEIIEAWEHHGYAKQKRDELHKIAEANRAFSHYKWW